MNLAENEKFKLTATWLNTLAAAAVVAGVIAPLASLRFGDLIRVPDGEAIMFSLIWLLAGCLLHVIAREILEELVE